ncbi:MAG: hypothetical protein ABSA58_13265, partial [Acetobacteraceae bacterium]
MTEAINHGRRRILGTAAMTLAVSPFVMTGTTAAQPGSGKSTGVPAISPGTNTSFSSLKQINAGLLNVGYAEAG